MSELPPQRRPDGTFLPGSCGNPTGRPRVVAEIVELAREHSPAALAALVGIATDAAQPAAARVSAATALLDRGYGRPASSLDVHVLKPTEAPALDLGALTIEERDALLDLMEKAAASRILGPSGQDSVGYGENATNGQ